MPIYEYECAGCGCRCEYLQGVNDEPITKCQECGKALQRVVSQTSFRLTGSGWYETDEKKKVVKGKVDKPDKADKTDKAVASEKIDQKKTDSSVKKDKNAKEKQSN